MVQSPLHSMVWNEVDLVPMAWENKMQKWIYKSMSNGLTKKRIYIYKTYVNMTWKYHNPCADPEICVNGGPGQTDRKNLTMRLRPQLVLQRWFDGYYIEIYNFSRFQRVQHFPGGPTFSRWGGGHIVYSYRNLQNLVIFPGGGGVSHTIINP